MCSEDREVRHAEVNICAGFILLQRKSNSDAGLQILLGEQCCVLGVCCAPASELISQHSEMLTNERQLPRVRVRKVAAPLTPPQLLRGGEGKVGEMTLWLRARPQEQEAGKWKLGGS